jgi:hypothetical protein
LTSEELDEFEVLLDEGQKYMLDGQNGSPV